MQLKTLSRSLSACLVMASMATFSVPASAEWRNSIGTGMAFVNITGNQGWQTPKIPIIGSQSVNVPLDYNPSDINDMMDSAFGFGGAATDGTWLIQYSYGSMRLEQAFSGVSGPLAGSYLSGESYFTATGAEITAGYSVYQSNAVKVFADTGVRYTKQKFENSLRSTGTMTFNIENKFSEEWVDALFGVTVNVPLAKTVVWGSRFNYGIGDSEGTYFASTGVTWRFADNWATGASLKYTKVDYVNGNKGDSDWYLYKAEETVFGINVLYSW